MLEAWITAISRNIKEWRIPFWWLVMVFHTTLYSEDVGVGVPPPHSGWDVHFNICFNLTLHGFNLILYPPLHVKIIFLSRDIKLPGKMILQLLIKCLDTNFCFKIILFEVALQSLANDSNGNGNGITTWETSVQTTRRSVPCTILWWLCHGPKHK